MKKINILFIALSFGTFLNAQEMAMVENTKTNFIDTKIDTTKSKDSSTALEKLEQVDESLMRNNGKKKKADKLYNRMGYMKSVDLYQEIQADKQVTTPSMMVGLADSYRLNGDTEAAEYWYAQYIREAQNAEDFLHYAQVLQSNGKCEDAIRWYKKYQSKKGKTKMTFIENCSELQTFKANEDAIIKNASSLNSPHLDFSPMPYQDKMVFTSSRGIGKMVVHKDNWTKKDFTDLFIAEKTGEYEFSAVKPLSGNTNKKFHDGTATFSPDGATMIFTRNNQKGKSSKDVINLQLMAAKYKNDNWTDIRPLPFNSKEWNTCHPSLSADGMTLYFASDQEGGFGGMDIYVSKNVNGEWQKPTVLGPEVNSEGNELFPYIDKEGVLYFSSNGHKGIGGLDIFKVKQAIKGDNTSWANRENMGHKINSPKDDFGFVRNAGSYLDKNDLGFVKSENNNTGWLTSNRLGGQGGDDIYYWKMKVEEEKPSKKMICVKDAITGKKISNAIVNVIKTPFSASFEENWQTDRAGVFAFPILKGENYGMTASKEGYLEESIALSAAELMENDEYCIEMKRPKGVLMKGKVIIDAYESLLPGATVSLFNHCTQESQTFISDEFGAFELRLDCDCKYDLSAEKSTFVKEKQAFTVMNMDCEEGQNIEKVLRLKFPTTTPAPTEPSLSIEEPLKVGTIIRLDDLYYDYNKDYIRADAAIELDKVVGLMKKYPSLEIEMRSHTDARGSRRYNEDLSDRRARSAMQYLIKRGVSVNRLTAKGYGENILTNECADGVNCDDRKHQENRRTEIKVTNLNEADLIIKD